MRLYKVVLAFASLMLILAPNSFSQRRNAKAKPPVSSFSEKDFDALHWRFVGTHRGGRASSVCGVPGQPNVFYMAATGGGVWKTIDGGNSWRNISDGFFGGSIGAVQVAPSDPNIIYVGCGEKTVRGNVSPGYGGVYKSYDAGKTWESIGLFDRVQVGQIVVHPRDPQIVFVAVIGDLFKDSEDRGIFRSIDGGKTWEKVLYANARSGGVDITFDPSNPRQLFASTWNVRRTPYSFSSGGDGSALWVSKDMGKTWKDISGNEGLPKGPLGIIGVSVSPVDHERVYAIIEAKNGGLFRSDDGGEKWMRVSQDRNLRQRAWYYSKVFADTKERDRVYVMNVQFWVSDDGGKSFKTKRTPHGDHHDLWISPDNNDVLAVADDGGVQISYDAADHWSSYKNQATSQYYRITTDDAFPFRIYVAQQDNSTQRIPHRTSGGLIGEGDWEASAGGESAHLAPDPKDPEIVYGGSYDGYLSRYDHRTKQLRLVDVWPDNPMGHGAGDSKYRFQWNFPLFFSPNDSEKLYAASNHLHVSTNEGQSWQVISPDLTRNEAEKLVSSGGPITQDNTSVEYYATLFAVCESPFEPGLIWAASDDGLVHLRKDENADWMDVTPIAAPKYIMWNRVEPDPHLKGGAYLAGTLYKEGDYKPYLFRTKDYGESWTLITNGIPSDHFTRVLRADPDRKGLLIAGTEYGVYFSIDDGQNWKSFQLNLPIVPITDMVIKEKNLIISTQGRGVYMIDDLSLLHQLQSVDLREPIHLFAPKDAYRAGRFNKRREPPYYSGENHHNGVEFFFHVAAELSDSDTVFLEIMDASGEVVRTFKSKTKEKADSLTIKKGSNSFLWNMHYADAKGFDGLIMWAGNLRGPKAVPGDYSARMRWKDYKSEVTFKILKDPRSSSGDEDLSAQFDFVMRTTEKLTETHEAIKEMRTIKGQLQALRPKLIVAEEKETTDDLDSLVVRIDRIENELYQTKNRSGQDPLNFPIRLNNKLAAVKGEVSIGNYRPTDQALDVEAMLTKEIDRNLSAWKDLKEGEIAALNKKVIDLRIDLIGVPEAED